MKTCDKAAKTAARIVVIDDHEMTRDVLKKFLSRVGYSVSVASDGKEGEAKTREAETHLVVTDVLMPDQDGLETIMNLKKCRPSLPVIAISGGGQMKKGSLLHLAERLGADRVLKKPLDRRSFLAAVHELLQAQQPAQSAPATGSAEA